MRKVARFHNMLLASISALAFDNKNVWKVDADGKIVMKDGHPVYLDFNGAEQTMTIERINSFNSEAATHRSQRKKAEDDLKKYERDGKLLDPELAFKAIETVGKLDAKKLIDAGEVDKLTDQIKTQFTQQLTEAQTALKQRETELDNLHVANVFANSEFIRNRVAVPRDMFEASMRPYIKRDKGKNVYLDRDGNTLMSAKNVGSPVDDPEEAFELLVNRHPQKDVILKATQQSGSGNNGNGGNRGGGNTIKRTEFDAMSPADKQTIGARMQKGEVSVID